MTSTRLEEPTASRRLLWQVPLALALAALAIWVVGARPILAPVLYLTAVSGELCRVDIREHRLPNTLVLPGYVFAAVGLVWEWLAGAAVPGVTLSVPLWMPLLSGGAYLAFLLVLNLAGGMGMGDVKLAGVLGLALGALGVVPSIAGPVLGFVSGGVAGLAAVIAPNLSTWGRIPFGPFMLFGFWAAVALAEKTA